MQNRPLVSVIIPTFNRSEFVQRAIESVLHQTYWNFEIIIVDDGSTDETIHTVTDYFPHVTYLHQKNKGVSAARNFGVSHSSGEYVAFLDSDDEWLPEKLKKHIFFMQCHGYEISQTDERWVRNGKHLNKKKKHEKPIGDIFIPSLSLCLVTPSAVIIKKELFEQYGGFDESLPACEDYDLWLRMGAHEKFGYLNETLVIKYGGHDDQLSATPILDKYRIIALSNLLQNDSSLKDEYKDATHEKLKEKLSIFIQGAQKRNKRDEILWAETIQKNHFVR